MALTWSQVSYFKKFQRYSSVKVSIHIPALRNQPKYLRFIPIQVIYSLPSTPFLSHLIQIITVFLLIFLQVLLVPISTFSTHTLSLCALHMSCSNCPWLKRQMACNHKNGKTGLRYLSCTRLLNQKWDALANSSSNADLKWWRPFDQSETHS